MIVVVGVLAVTVTPSLSQVVRQLEGQHSHDGEPVTLLVDREVQADGDEIDIPEWLDLQFLGSGRIVCAGNVCRLRLPREPRAGLWQVFGSSPGGMLPSVEFKKTQRAVYPDWWGGGGLEYNAWKKQDAAARDGHAKAFQAALDSVQRHGGTVRIAPGTYYLTRALRIHGGTTLSGDTPNCARMSWFDSDGIVVDPGAADTEISGIRMGRYATSSPLPPARFDGIRFSEATDLRIVDVAVIASAENPLEFEVGIRQQAIASSGPGPVVARQLRVEDTRVVGNRTRLIVLDQVEDALFDRLLVSRLEPTEHVKTFPRTIGVTIGRADLASPCRDIRFVDCCFEFHAIDVLVVRGDGLRFEGCSFEPDYSYSKLAKGKPFEVLSAEQRRFIHLDAGTPKGRALSGEGLALQHCYFYETFGDKGELEPPARISAANPADLCMADRYRVEGSYRATPASAVPPRYSAERVHMTEGDRFVSDNPGSDGSGWVCVHTYPDESDGVWFPFCDWSPLAPSPETPNGRWVPFGITEELG